MRFDPNNLRPICLLETPKKIFKKILSKRIDKITQESLKIRAWNWAESQGGFTHPPIKILNYALEDAKENKKRFGYYFKT